MASTSYVLPLEPLFEYARRQAGTGENSTLPDKDFATMVGVSARTVARWRAAAGGIPWGTADETATALGVHATDIWGELWSEMDRSIIDGTADPRVMKAIEKAMERIGEVMAEEAKRASVAA